MPRGKKVTETEVQREAPLPSIEELILNEISSLTNIIEDGFTKIAVAIADIGRISHSDPATLATHFPMKDEEEDAVIVEEPAPEEPKVTLDDVRARLNEYTRAHGLADAVKIVSELGVKRLSELKPERYGEAVKAFAYDQEQEG